MLQQSASALLSSCSAVHVELPIPIPNLCTLLSRQRTRRACRAHVSKIRQIHLPQIAALQPSSTHSHEHKHTLSLDRASQSGFSPRENARQCTHAGSTPLRSSCTSLIIICMPAVRLLRNCMVESSPPSCAYPLCGAEDQGMCLKSRMVGRPRTSVPNVWFRCPGSAPSLGPHLDTCQASC